VRQITLVARNVPRKGIAACRKPLNAPRKFRRIDGIKKAVVSPMDSSGDVERRHKPPSEQVL
jgi:hypothetical protein